MVDFNSLLLGTLLSVFANGQSLNENEHSSSRNHRRLELDIELIGGYQPLSTVTDYAAIDRDLSAMEDELDRESDDGFSKARKIYEQGGHSKSYAEIRIDRDIPNLLPGTQFTGENETGGKVTGISYPTSANDLLNLRYESEDGYEGAYPSCQVGALDLVNKERIDGCFAAAGSLETTHNGVKEEYTYTYDPLEDNKNGRTIKGFSLLLRQEMLDDTNEYTDIKHIVDYYGTLYYANEWIEAAFENRATTFERGAANFASYGRVGRGEVIKVGALTMNVLTYALRELGDAVVDCRFSAIDSPLYALRNWDEGAALYIGSLEGETGSLSGKLLYRLADKYCSIFRTCGKSGSQTSGTSAVNHNIIALLEKGKELMKNKKCQELSKVRQEIANLMYVPVIQGVLNAAYNIEFFDGYQRHEAQGSAFAAAVLPKVHAVNKHAAKVIYNNMRVGAPVTSHKAVKEAFQSVYKDMGIDCSIVGGMWHESLGIYYKGGAPCLQSQDSMTTFILIGAFGSIFFGLIGTYLYYRSKNKTEEVEYFVY